MANSLFRREPYGGLSRLEPFGNIDDFFRDFLAAPSLALRGRDAPPPIRVDIAETDQHYLLKAEVPGVKKDDLKVSIDGNRVSISAEVRQESGGNGEGYSGVLHNERYYGQQYRSFALPQEVDDKAAGVRYQDGILELTLPKKAGTGGRQLSIQ